MGQPHSSQTRWGQRQYLGERDEGTDHSAKTSPGRSSQRLLVLLFSVGDDVHQVLVVQVTSHVRGEGGEHLVNLQ